MQIHHLHYGLVLIFVGTIILLFFGRNFWVIIFLGYGLGLAFDEFIGSLRLPEYRPLGLEIYKKAFKPTLALFLIVSLLLLGTALMYFYK
ncbi:hypothetical protein A3I95_00570 [Candidatus Nomurabacteria bacterium RIFCSPLOWO2_02_FULL_44_12]|uniref:Uncharacterized protein n=1 Tax=Candidatus Nomurabacteria bacterium RIFCSPLOWO2_12_FULL_44_11 TaxID=1801796 RepID=A0A1F6Y7X2_9BACT|nr:MAG: hypothetical protein A3E95_01685 [Candidatus Nomurabacteria bacterium RIFCSPHIGHO2_12_FULL_44_22b]OGJ02468.1 MAG: hypothetical protein A3G53_01040 [Candidatus Nomurabacteria bacterium RIFCSPLOWO2_12_FULL_44_11]OGJ07303.1 MAG: hypothetical protein A3I95_00570 [Candidatus Nomurabacteria bacterium RIFCSPLOWO2_02_FULL_44_12]